MVSLGRGAGVGTLASNSGWARPRARRHLATESNRDRCGGRRPHRDICRVGHRRDSDRPSNRDCFIVPDIRSGALASQPILYAVHLLERDDARPCRTLFVAVVVPGAPPLLSIIRDAIVILFGLGGRAENRRAAGKQQVPRSARNDKTFALIRVFILLEFLGTAMKPTFTIGIEEEYQTIDPETRDLRSHIHAEILEKGKLLLQERVKAEMHQSVVEVGTGVCKNIKEAKAEVKMLRRDIVRLAKENGLRLASVATHPFSDWRTQDINPDDRYKHIVEDMQLVARANLIFGLHVHIGIEDRETAIHMMNHSRYFLPHLLALSTNSPFWLGMNTGLKSYRCKVFDKFPRTNIPDYFPSWGEYENFIKLLIKTNCIDNAKKIWWDIRPHPFFNTIEFRVCDIPMRADETIAIAALIQATVAKLYKLHTANQGFRLYRRALIMENKWRASRYGMDGKLIDFGKQIEVPARDLIREYLEFVDDVVDELDSREELNYIHTMLDEGSGADRQLRVYQETGDLKKVVDYIIEETEAGLAEVEPASVRKVG
jgi:glutamate---cysteine ligase / carboxylate-amine ligase